MPKSHAFFRTTEPWAEFSKQSDSIFDQNFVRDKILTFKTIHQTSSGTIKFKQLVQLKNGRYQLEEQLKLWFPFGSQGSNVFSEIKKDQVKIRYDHGLRLYKSRLINFYGCFHTSKTVSNAIAKFGANFIGVNTNFDHRIRFAHKDSGKTQVSSDHKINWTNQKWSIDLCHTLNYSLRSLTQNNFRFIYFIDQNSQFFVKAENRTAREAKKVNFTSLDTYFTQFVFDYVRRINSSVKIGLQICIQNKKHNYSSIVAEKLLPNSQSKLKAKLSTNKLISVSLQSRINNYGRWAIGWEVSDLGRNNQSKYGLLVDLNL